MNPESKKAARAEYMRLWRINNPEAAKEIDRRSRGKKKERQRVWAKNWYANNRELCIERSHNNMKMQVALGARKIQSKIWRDKNKEKCATYGRNWRTKNKGHVAYLAMTRLANKRLATPAWFNHGAVKALYQKAHQLTLATGVKYHVDHIIPLQSDKVCGLHWHGNMQIIPAIDNIKKSNKFESRIL